MTHYKINWVQCSLLLIYPLRVNTLPLFNLQGLALVSSLISTLHGECLIEYSVNPFVDFGKDRLEN